TRLQVEHPVTEEICGVDLVEWQIRVASGEPLPARQEDLKINGHAFEARLYAEDVPAGFLPATGTLSDLSFPEGLRAETGVRAGDAISPHYDPMIAKLVAHGPTRAVALRRLARGLRNSRVAGTVTNLAFLGALAEHEGFARGEVDTGLIARDIDALTAQPEVTPAVWAEAALTALGLTEAVDWETGFALWRPEWRRVVLEQGGTRREIGVKVRGPGSVLVSVEGQVVEALRGVRGWTFDDTPAAGAYLAPGQVTVFAHYGIAFDLPDPLARGAAAAGALDGALAPMPGRVVSVHVGVGQEVAEGDRLVVLEAMKMEHTMRAGRAGVVSEVLVAQGDQVEAGAPLVLLEEEA
ncbi:3-methylcrotonyl-CoA carboxylase, partial [Mameliella sp. AT18]|uniref:biotin/lipoyl-containing protein n=1 Tax=Mameliella sp. AT18 TaxID=3028385 RepID=UPI0030846460|nr:3-methylcrotonyl-CoA carboxylase [Mameliella sp. AT18]